MVLILAMHVPAALNLYFKLLTYRFHDFFPLDKFNILKIMDNEFTGSTTYSKGNIFWTENCSEIIRCNENSMHICDSFSLDTGTIF